MASIASAMCCSCGMASGSGIGGKTSSISGTEKESVSVDFWDDLKQSPRCC